jgi:hypothetical protein
MLMMRRVAGLVVRGRVKRQVDDTTYCRGVKAVIAVVVVAVVAALRELFASSTGLPE